MKKLVVYKTEDNGTALVIPAEKCLAEHTIQEIAEKDVPAGKPYKIVSVDDIPSDRTFRGAWTVDEAELTDGIGGEYDMFITDPQHPDYVAPIEGELSE